MKPTYDELLAQRDALYVALLDMRARFHRACLSNGSDVWAADVACSGADAALAKVTP
jgi:hypothetical protein